MGFATAACAISRFSATTSCPTSHISRFLGTVEEAERVAQPELLYLDLAEQPGQPHRSQRLEPDRDGDDPPVHLTEQHPAIVLCLPLVE